MSLDITLVSKEAVERSGTGVFIYDGGNRRELTIEEVREKWPDADVASQEYKTNDVFKVNITHNLAEMASKADIYYAMWRPEERGYGVAEDIILPLTRGIEKLRANPELFKKLNPQNGWGSYDTLLTVAEDYLEACRSWPDATIEVSR